MLHFDKKVLTSHENDDVIRILLIQNNFDHPKRSNLCLGNTGGNVSLIALITWKCQRGH